LFILVNDRDYGESDSEYRLFMFSAFCEQFSYRCLWIDIYDEQRNNDSKACSINEESNGRMTL